SLFRVGRKGVTDRIPIPSAPPFAAAVAAATGAVWVVDPGADSVTRVDPRTRKVVTTISLGAGSHPTAVAADDDTAWVANSGTGTVTRIDAATNATTSIRLPGSPAGVALGAGRVWVTLQPGFRSGKGLLRAGATTEASVPTLPSAYCSPVFFAGRGKPDFLIASDLPFAGLNGAHKTLQLSDAVRFVLA